MCSSDLLLAFCLKCAASYTFPCDWNPHSRTLSLTKKRWKLVRHNFKFVLGVSHLAVLLWAGNPYTAADLGRIQGLVTIFCHIIMVIAQIMTISPWLLTRNRTDEYIAFSTQLNSFIRQESGRPSTRRVHVQARAMHLLIVGFRFSCLCNFFLCLTAHGSAVHVDYILSEHHRSIATFAASSLIIASVCKDSRDLFAFSIGIGYAYCVTMSHVFGDLLKIYNKAPFASIARYRALVILNAAFNGTVGKTFLAINKTIFEIAGPFFIVFAIRFHKDSTLLALLFMAMSAIVNLVELVPIVPLAQPYEQSREFLGSLSVTSLRGNERKLLNAIDRKSVV